MLDYGSSVLQSPAVFSKRSIRKIFSIEFFGRQVDWRSIQDTIYASEGFKPKALKIVRALGSRSPAKVKALIASNTGVEIEVDI